MDITLNHGCFAPPRKLTLDQQFKLVGAFLCCLTIALLYAMQPHLTLASGEAALTDLFQTTAFSGSWSVFSKLNWVGAILNYIISIFCFLGLFMVVARIVITMLYLSGRNLFDSIDEIKGKGKGQKAFGFGAMAKEVYSANYGTGLDAFVGFFLALMPNVKAYSDYADGKMSGNLQEDDTITTYILKISLPSILTIFFFAIGFNGVLWQAFGNVVGAMGVASETLVNQQLSQYVERALNTGSNYSFTYSSDGTKLGTFKQNVAKSVNSKVLREVTDLTSDSKLTIGGNIDKWLSTQLNAAKIDKVIGSSTATNDADASNLEYSVTVNTHDDYSDTVSKSSYYVVQSFKDLGIEEVDGSPKYVHLIVTKKANSTSINYFEVKSSTKGSSSTSQDAPDDAVETGVN